MFTHPQTGVVYCCDVIGTNVLFYEKADSVANTWATARVVTAAGDYDRCGLGMDGPAFSVVLHNGTTDKLVEFRSTDWGRTWTGPFAVTP